MSSLAMRLDSATNTRIVSLLVSDSWSAPLTLLAWLKEPPGVGRISETGEDLFSEKPLLRIASSGASDRKSTRLNSSHSSISYAVFRLKKNNDQAVQEQKYRPRRPEVAHNETSVHGVLNPTHHPGLPRVAVQHDIVAERERSAEIEAGT